MDDQPLARRHKTEYIIPGNGFATIRKIVHNAVTALAEDDQLGILSGYCSGGLFMFYMLFYLGLGGASLGEMPQ